MKYYVSIGAVLLLLVLGILFTREKTPDPSETTQAPRETVTVTVPVIEYIDAEPDYTAYSDKGLIDWIAEKEYPMDSKISNLDSDSAFIELKGRSTFYYSLSSYGIEKLAELLNTDSRNSGLLAYLIGYFCPEWDDAIEQMCAAHKAGQTVYAQAFDPYSTLTDEELLRAAVADPDFTCLGSPVSSFLPTPASVLETSKLYVPALYELLQRHTGIASIYTYGPALLEDDMDTEVRWTLENLLGLFCPEAD